MLFRHILADKGRVLQEIAHLLLRQNKTAAARYHLRAAIQLRARRVDTYPRNSRAGVRLIEPIRGASGEQECQY